MKFTTEHEVCSLCNENKATTKEENEKNQKYRKNDLSDRELTLLFKRKKKYPAEFDNQTSIFEPRETFGTDNKFKIIDATWMNRWKSFVGEDGERPDAITNNAIRCECGVGSLICNTMDAISKKLLPSDQVSPFQSMGLPDAELISEEQWRLLRQLYPSENCFEVSLSLNDTNNWVWSPPPCPTCTDITNRNLEAMKINFDSCDIKIVIANDVSQCLEVAAVENTSRSSRKRKINSVVITASSTDNIYDIKMKICAVKDCAPNQQALYCNGNHMNQNNLRLKDYNVTATDTIYVMINEDDEDYCWDDNGNIEKEHGFAGTMLFSNNSKA